MATVLLTAVGSASAPLVVRSLQQKGHRVIGCDIYPQSWNETSGLVDGFFQSVLSTDRDAYLAMLTDAVQREAVQYIIPLTDPEVDVLCAEKARFAALGCTVCTPDEPCTRLCRDKLGMAEALMADAVCQTIPTVSPYGYTPAADAFPIMLKPNSGRSSQGQVVAHNLSEYAAALSLRADYIAQPFLTGDHLTVDVARDLYGNVCALTRQELLRTVNGLGTTVRVLPGHPLEAVCAGIARRAGIVGVVNMEFIGTNDGFFFLEVNPRFSGGVGFSIAAGADFALMQLICHAGECLPTLPSMSEMTLTRHIEPVITRR